MVRFNAPERALDAMVTFTIASPEFGTVTEFTLTAEPPPNRTVVLLVNVQPVRVTSSVSP
jgi:hypothetical protein